MSFSVVLFRNRVTADDNFEPGDKWQGRQIELIPSIDLQEIYNIRKADGNFGSYKTGTWIVSNFDKKVIEPFLSSCKFAVKSKKNINGITTMFFYSSLDQASKLFQQIQNKYPTETVY